MSGPPSSIPPQSSVDVPEPNPISPSYAFSMPFTEKRLFLLLYSHHASFLQSMMNSLYGERLVDDVGKWFGKLASIFSLSRIDKMLSMYVGRRKLSRMTPQRLLERRECFLQILETVLGLTPADLAAA